MLFTKLCPTAQNILRTSLLEYLRASFPGMCYFGVYRVWQTMGGGPKAYFLSTTRNRTVRLTHHAPCRAATAADLSSCDRPWSLKCLVSGPLWKEFASIFCPSPHPLAKLPSALLWRHLPCLCPTPYLGTKAKTKTFVI